MLYGSLTGRLDIRAMQAVKTFACQRDYDVIINGFVAGTPVLKS